MAASVAYVMAFSLATMLVRRQNCRLARLRDEGVVGGTTTQCEQSSEGGGRNRFLVLYPAYKEDAVIVHSVTTFLEQDYPKELYEVVVISDNMRKETNEALASLGVTVLEPSFEKSSKAKALQYAIGNSSFATNVLNYTDGNLKSYVIIMDADNVVSSDFLRLLSASCSEGHLAIQCHRTAKNADNDIAVLDGVSEEINNSIFRRGHNAVGLSSALIGSGMCFDYHWFADHVGELSTAGEDKELEAMLLKERVFIKYEADIYVMDEKVSGSDNFERQRLRWMTAQVQCLVSMLPYVPKAIATGNMNYIDKTVQQALIPRSILLVLIPVMIVLTGVVGIVGRHWEFWWVVGKWVLLLIVLLGALLIAIPKNMRKWSVLSKAMRVPRLASKMMKNVVRINTRNKEFLHTEHGR